MFLLGALKNRMETREAVCSTLVTYPVVVALVMSSGPIFIGVN
jgi:hypothetical protein